MQAIRLRAAAAVSRVIEADQARNRATRTGSSSTAAFGHHPHSELALADAGAHAHGLGSVDDSDTGSETDDDDINRGQAVHTSIASLAAPSLTQLAARRSYKPARFQS